MSNALVGYSGFVGSNLIRQATYEYLYNSKNIETIVGKDFNLLVCAAAPATKWLANKEPIKDRENLQRLMLSLKQVSAQKLILISTVDVYPLPVEVDEKTEINVENLHPYGKHRLELETFVHNHFTSLIIRLPGLFGSGLKKNVIYDFMHNNLVDKIHQDSVFQFYNLEHLWQDIQTALKHDLNLVNFATEPTSVKEVATAFGFEFTNQPNQHPAQYDMWTKYFKLFNGCAGYLYTKNQVLQELKNFLQQTRRC